MRGRIQYSRLGGPRNKNKNTTQEIRWTKRKYIYTGGLEHTRDACTNI
jgi:hypothetical protein